MPYTGPFTGGYTNLGTIDGIVATNVLINGKLTNAGTISPNGIKLINSSIVTGDFVAILDARSNTGGISIDATSSLKGIIWVQGGFDGDIYNAGSMTGSFGILVYPTPFTGNIINAGSFTGLGTGGIGIWLNHAQVTGSITNSGSISSGDSTGIYILQSSLSGTISNTGTITGNVGILMDSGFAPGSGIRPPLGSAPALDIFNSGTITGTTGTAVQLATPSSGDNIFTLGPGYHVNGAVRGAGADTFQLGGGGSDSFDLGGIGGQYTGFVTFNAVGAIWTVSGSGSNWNVKPGAEMDLASGASLSATNVIGGELKVLSGGLAAGTTITGGGTEYVSFGGTANNVAFGDNAAVLALENPAALTGVLSNWQVGDKIDFVHTAVTSASIGNGGASLGIMTGDGHSYQYALAGLQANTQAFLQDDGAGGTLVQLRAAPGAPAIALAHDTGVLATDHVTNDPALVVIPAESGGTLLYKADGAASFLPTAPTFATDGSADGVHSVAVEQQNAAGAIGPAASFNFTLDTTAAHAGALTTSASGNKTAGASVEFTLAFDEAVHVVGGTPSLTLNNGATAHYDAAATAALHDASKLAFDYLVSSSDAGTATLAVTGLAANGSSFDDIAGNHAVVSGVTAQFNGLSVNHSGAPGAPAVALAHDTGLLASDHVTSDPTLVVTAAESGGTLLYKADGAASFSPAVPSFASDGVHSVSVEQQNAGGIVGPASSFIFTLDTRAAHVTGLTTSAAGNQNAGSTVEFTLGFDEAIHLAGGGTPTLALNNGATAHYDAAATAALHDASKLAFDYVVASIDYPTASLAVTGLAANGASFDDIAGNHAVVSGVAAQFNGLSVNLDFTTPPHLADFLLL